MPQPPERSTDDVAAKLAVSHVRCPGCQYDLHGLAHPKCPECGREVREADLASLDPEFLDVEQERRSRAVTGISITSAIGVLAWGFALLVGLGLHSVYGRGQPLGLSFTFPGIPLIINAAVLIGSLWHRSALKERWHTSRRFVLVLLVLQTFFIGLAICGIVFSP